MRGFRAVPIMCSREYSNQDDAKCIKVLKAWCVQCHHANDRNEHMDRDKFPNFVTSVPSDTDLDDQLVALPPPPDFATEV